MQRTRREILGGAAGTALLALGGSPLMAAAPSLHRFPRGFHWGASTAGHQVEGNNINADTWLLENIKPTNYAEPSGDAVNSFALWPQDLDLVKRIGLNSYRFSLEWSRIEPEPGRFSLAMLDHYKAMIEGCRQRGITPVVTFNHFTTPRWFAAQGGWTNNAAPGLFARFCEKAARHLAASIGYATTLNEPNLMQVQRFGTPATRIERQRQMLQQAAKITGSAKYAAGNAIDYADIAAATKNLIAGHRAGRDAIKSVRPGLPVGVSLAVIDEQAAPGGEARRDAVRTDCYAEWLEAIRGDDFVGVQNYERNVWGADGKLPTPAGVETNGFRGEVYPASLAGAVRYVHQTSGVPVMVTEHGVVTPDDAVRARFIPAALDHLRAVIDEGVPVLGYLHWSLLDNFEWGLGYWPKFGLVAVDRKTFVRTPKPSAAVLGAIARRNAS